MALAFSALQKVNGCTSLVTTEAMPSTQPSPSVNVFPGGAAITEFAPMNTFFSRTTLPAPRVCAMMVVRRLITAPSWISMFSGYSFSRYTSSPMKTLPRILTPRRRCRKGRTDSAPGSSRANRCRMRFNDRRMKDFFIICLEGQEIRPLQKNRKFKPLPSNIWLAAPPVATARVEPRK
jgi:hypothetical protein